MRQFKSLNPAGMRDEFDAERDGAEPKVEIQQAEGRITINYTFPGVYLVDEQYDIDGVNAPLSLLDMPEVGSLRESGKPELPSFGRYVQIPANCTFTYEVKKSAPVLIEGVSVSPAQENLMDQPGPSEFEYDREFYKSDALYPKDVVEVSGPKEMDGYKALLVHVRPFQYKPAQKTLHGYSNITVTIALEQAEDDEAQPYVDDDVDLRAFGNHVLNPKRNLKAVLGSRLKPIAKPILWQHGPSFLIIYHPPFKRAALQLQRWKQQQGMRTAIVSIDDIGNDAAKIKKYIRKRRKHFRSRLRYVLLLGDVDHIAAEQAQYGDSLTDYYYSTKEDPASNGDYQFPWLAIGRIPVRTEQQARDVVDQIIDYERTPPGSPDYYTRMSFGAYFQDDSPQDDTANRKYVFTMEAIRQHLISLDYDVERVYVTNNQGIKWYKNGTAIPDDVKDAIVTSSDATNMIVDATTEGQLIIGHRDHGSRMGWAHPSFKMSHLDDITGDEPNLFFSINCQTGRFDYPSETQPQSECFAEKLLRLKRGAPSLIAATRNSGTWRNDDLEKALFDALWPGIITTFPGNTYSYPVKGGRLGDMLNYAKSYLPLNHGASGVRHHHEIYHVIGDPTLQIWTEPPKTTRVWARIFPRTAPMIVTRRAKLLIRLSNCPADAVVTIMHGSKVLKRIQPRSTRITIPLRELISGPWLPHPPLGRPKLRVCFSAPGHRYTEARVRL